MLVFSPIPDRGLARSRNLCSVPAGVSTAGMFVATRPRAQLTVHVVSYNYVPNALVRDRTLYSV